jgi:hypothetical protein
VTDPLQSGPTWEAFDSGSSGVASAVIGLGSPRANPGVPGITLYLQIEDDDNDGYFWSVGIGEEMAGFGEATVESGTATDLLTAQEDSWAAAVAYLRDDGYTNEEITESISQPAGSMELDLDDDYDE